jgi:predicted GNAT superfamily acetyltransferase
MGIAQSARKSLNWTIRPSVELDELKRCVALQNRIWGYADNEGYPLRLFVNVSRTGGHVLGAFTPQGEMAGFVVSLPAWRGRRRFVHSLSLGVLPAYRSQGLGRALKFEQRKLALREGIDHMEWTFDPLRARNAFFNLVRLGAVVRRYVPDYYGPLKSQLQLGLPSDRLIAEWWLRSPRVKRALAKKPPRAGRKAPAAQIAIPEDLEALVKSDPRRAREWQAAVREELQKCFARKLVITGFEKSEARYLLDRI